MTGKQELPGLEDPRWMPLGADEALWMVADWVNRGVRVAYREREGDHTGLVLANPSQPPPEPLYVEGPSKYFYYLWSPDLSVVFAPPWSQEEERVRRKAGLKEKGVFPPPAPRQRGRKAKADWKVYVANYVGRIEGAGEELPTAAEVAERCLETLGYEPDIGEINKLLKALKTLRVQETRD
jgi:hypothetical protein